MSRWALPAALCLMAAAAGGCGDDGPRRPPPGPLRVYVSAPDHGSAAAAGRAVVAGARRALRDAGGSAGGRRIRLVALSANRPGDDDWDPGTVEANAKRAGDDPRAIAYIGEVDRGASAVSVPRTNAKTLLQVSPADGLASLTRSIPADPRAGPERYYPSGRRNFLRIVPSDSVLADTMVALARPAVGRRIAVVETADFAERELGKTLAAKLRAARAAPVATIALGDSDDKVPGAIRDLAAARPEVVMVAGEPGAVASEVLDGVSTRLPGARLMASPALASQRGVGGRGAVGVSAVAPLSRQPRGARLLAARLGSHTPPEAVYGYDAMRLVVAAIDSKGADRRAVIAAALRPRHVRGVTGGYDVLPAGEVFRPRLAVISLRDGRATTRRPAGLASGR